MVGLPWSLGRRLRSLGRSREQLGSQAEQRVRGVGKHAVPATRYRWGQIRLSSLGPLVGSPEHLRRQAPAAAFRRAQAVRSLRYERSVGERLWRDLDQHFERSVADIAVRIPERRHEVGESLLPKYGKSHQRKPAQSGVAVGQKCSLGGKHRLLARWQAAQGAQGKADDLGVLVA